MPGYEVIQYGVLGYEMKDHLDKCMFNQISCAKCEGKYNNYQKAEHDCMKHLRDQILHQSNEIKYNLEQHGKIEDIIKPKCPRNHILKLIRGKPLGYNGTA